MERFLKNIRGSKFWKRTLALMLSLAVLVTLAPGNVYQAFSDGTLPSILNGTNIDLTALTLKACYYDENGKWIETVLTQGDDFTEFPYNATVEMNLDFTMFSSETLEAGKQYVYQLPDTIRVDENNVTHDLAYETANGSTSIGTVTIYNTGELVFTFNENITNQTNIPFYVRFDGELAESLQDKDQSATLSFPTANGQFDFNIRTSDATDEDVEKDPSDIGMSKTGGVVTVDGSKYIQWTITLESNGRDSLSGNINDYLPEGLSYAQVDGYPRISQNWSSYTPMTGVQIADGSTDVSIPLSDAKGSTVSVQFLTNYDASLFGQTITDQSSADVKNSASFVSDDTDDKPVDASNQIWVSPNMVSKSGGSGVTDDNTITWTVTINQEQFDIGGCTYTDTFGDGIDWTDDGGNITCSESDVTVVKSADGGFTISFPEHYNKTVTLTYTTKVTDFSQTQFKNKGVLTNPDGSYDYTREETVNGLDLLRKSFVSYNSITREFTWNIYVNHAGQSLTNVVVTDYLKTDWTNTEPMQFVGASVSGTEGTEYTGFSMDSIPEDEIDYAAAGSTGLNFRFDTLNAPVIITVVTKMDSDYFEANKNTSQNFYNYSELVSDEVTKKLEAQAGTYVSITEPQLIESKEGTINSDGTIDWTVVVKSQSADYIPDAYILSDILPESNEYVEGSLYVSNRWFDADPITSDDITVTCEKNNLDRYVLSAEISKSLGEQCGKTWFTDGSAFEIHYKTRVTDYEIASESHSYTNEAEITADYPGIEDVSDTETKTVTGVAGGVLDKTYVYKSGDSKVTWTVSINEAGMDMSAIDNPKIVDQLEDYFDYVPYSGILYKVTGNGRERVDTGDYEVSATNGKIIVWLPNIGSDTYEFEFQTEFNVRAEALAGTRVTNHVSFEGDGVIATKESQQVSNVNFSSSSAGSYLRQELRIQKVDSESNTPLTGAVFRLIRNGEVVAEEVTDSDGWAIFDNMDFGASYEVVEYQAPDGYEKTEDPRTFDFENDDDLVIITESAVSQYYQYIWKNEAVQPASATIRATKVDGGHTDASGNPVVITDSASFGLYSDANCQNLVDSRTTTNGVVTFSGITADGTYYIKEINPPKGYTLSDEAVKVDVTSSTVDAVTTYTVTYYGKDGNAVADIDADAGYLYENSKAVGTLEITKVEEDADTVDLAARTKIQGVTFEVYTDALARDCIASGITDANGVVSFDNLELGKTYYYREISAPANYIKDDTIYSFVIGTGTETVNQIKSVVVENEQALGSIVVTKVDDNVTPNPLGGVEFALKYKDANGQYLDYMVPSASDSSVEVIYTVITDSNGVARFENLPFGDYQIVETVPEGYRAVSETTNVTVSKVEDTNVQIVNEVVRFNIKVTKTDDSNLPMPNVGFTLYTASGIPVYTDVRTDANGSIEFTGLKYGEYRLSETYTPTGYTATGDVWIRLDGANGVKEAVQAAGASGTPVVAVTVVNEKQNGALLAHKTDEQGNALAGAAFALYDESNKVVATGKSLTSAEAAAKTAELAASAVWNTVALSEGDIWFDELSFGTYYLVETSAPNGYQTATGKYEVQIKESGVVVTEGTDRNSSSASSEPLTIMNTTSVPPYISFKVKKVNEDGTPLSDAEFYLYEDDDRTTPVAKATTDSDGIAYFRQIKTGDGSGHFITNYYSIVEAQAPYGYTKSDEVLYIYADSLGQYVDDEDHPLANEDINFVNDTAPSPSDAGGATITDKKILGNIQITKYGTTKLVTLPNAEFALYKITDGGDVLIGNAATNADGIAVFTDLEVGSYYVRETKAPTGYTLSDKIVNIDITRAMTYTAEYTDTRLQLSVSKQSAAQSGEIPGAHLTLYKVVNRTRTEVDSWTSTTEVHKVSPSKLESGVDYELVETLAPSGYGYSKPVSFRIKEDGTVVILDEHGNEQTNPYDKTVVMKDTPISLSVLKADENGTALPNAILAIYDGSQEILRWTTTSSAKVIDHTLLTAPSADGTYHIYTLREISAPGGYALAADMKFAVGYDGGIYEVAADGTVGAAITNAAITMTDTLKPDTSIYVMKMDGGTGIDLAGARFQLLDVNGNQVDLDGDGVLSDADTLVSNGTSIEIKDIDTIIAGTGSNQFTLKEVGAPTGYDIAEPLSFAVSMNPATNKYEISVSYDNRDKLNAAKDTLTVSDNELELHIRKQDGFGMMLAGAELVLYEKTGSGNVLVGDAFISSQTEVITVDSALLKTNTTYILHETNAPAGYSLASDIEFTIHEDGSITRADGIPVYNNTVIMQDDESDVTIHKVIEGTNHVLTGVTLQLTSQDDPYFQTMTWTSGEDVKVWEIAFTELTIGCTYTLSEIQAPAGYAYAEPIEFTVGDDRQIYVDGETVNLRDIVMEDAELEFYISKQDMTSQESLAGAKLQLKDAEGNIVYEFTSGDAKTLVPSEKLVAAKPGEYKIYTLTELTAPEGYEIAETMTFALDSKGEAYLVTVNDKNETVYEALGNTVTMLDEPMLSFSKQDIAGDEIPGARITITAEDDDSFVPIEFVSGTTPKYFSWDSFEAGKTYVMTETAAPQGYLYSESITFMFDEEHNIYVNGSSKPIDGKSIVMTDEAITVQISKQNSADSSGLPGATLVIKDKEGTVIYTFVSDAAPVLIPNTVFTAPEKGSMSYYSLTELTAPEGFEIAETIYFAINDTGKIFVRNADGVYEPMEGNTIVMFDKAVDTIHPKTGDTVLLQMIILLALLSFFAACISLYRYLYKR